MFGYVKPLRSELKVKDFEQFKAAYCGLCHTLKRRYGWFSRFILNYDFTFLAIVLSQTDEGVQYEHLRCVASPHRKKCVCVQTAALDLAADDSVILTYWKLKDSVSDSSFAKSLKYRLLSLLFRPAYKAAARRRPEFDKQTVSCLKQLQELETRQSPSLDRTADTFAKILQSAALGVDDPAKRRSLEQILYHLGRWIYIVDAYDDLSQDMATGNYNPIVLRFGLKDPVLDDADRETVRTTLQHSLNLMASAFELVDFGVWSDILGNIIYLGLPTVGQQVLCGKSQVLSKINNI